MNNPYSIEKIRQKFALAGQLKRLKNTYNKKFPEIKDVNNSSFWNNRYLEKIELECQDGMTKDRIKIAVSFIPSGKQRILDVGVGLGWVEEIIEKDTKKKIFGNDIS